MCIRREEFKFSNTRFLHTFKTALCRLFLTCIGVLIKVGPSTVTSQSLTYTRLIQVSTATGQSFTYPEFWNQVDNVSQQLQQRGFKEGQVLAIYCHNCPEYLITLFSVWKVGGSVACVNSLWTTGI